MTDPLPTSALNEQLREIVRSSRRVIWGIIIAEGVLLLAVSVVAGILAYRQLTERTRIEQVVTSVESSQCAFYYSLGSVPVSVKTTSNVALQLIENSRIIVHDLRCPQNLAPPSIALLQLGAKYHVPIVR